MRLSVYIAMLGWPVVSLLLFATLPARRAVLLAVFGGWLLLPQASISISGLPDYSRSMAVLLGVVAGVWLCDQDRLTRIRLRRFDLPIILFCICPLASSLSNGLGFYDGISAVLDFTINYGIPYFIGRLYFSDRDGMRALAVGLVVAVLCYTPLILYELRMSPQLHRQVYGFLQIPFHMIWRLGWYRPMVFLRHGLELGVLLAGAVMTAVWTWRNRSVPEFGWLSPAWAALVLVVVCLLCRAVNGYCILTMGLGALYSTRIFKARIAVILLVLLPSVYIFMRVVTNWDAAPLVEATETIYPERAFSLQSRISQEITLIDKALQRPTFGWGGWNRNRADELASGAKGKKSITDSYWIIILGQRGIVGLLTLGLVLLRPILLLARRLPPEGWSDAENAPAAALSMVLLGFTIDCLVNAMYSPIYFMIAGGLIAYKPVLSPHDNQASESLN